MWACLQALAPVPVPVPETKTLLDGHPSTSVSLSSSLPSVFDATQQLQTPDVRSAFWRPGAQVSQEPDTTMVCHLLQPEEPWPPSRDLSVAPAWEYLLFSELWDRKEQIKVGISGEPHAAQHPNVSNKHIFVWCFRKLQLSCSRFQRRRIIQLDLCRAFQNKSVCRKPEQQQLSTALIWNVLVSC